MQGSEATDPLHQLAYCGLHCGTCYLRNGHGADHAKHLLAELEAMRFEQWGPALARLNPGEFAAFRETRAALDVLRAWNAMRCERSCRAGGGSADCKIRECCQASHRTGCWECDQVEHCETLAVLKPVNGNLSLDNLRRIKVIGVAAFLAEAAKQEQLTFYSDPE